MFPPLALPLSPVSTQGSSDQSEVPSLPFNVVEPNVSRKVPTEGTVQSSCDPTLRSAWSSTPESMTATPTSICGTTCDADPTSGTRAVRRADGDAATTDASSLTRSIFG